MPTTPNTINYYVAADGTLRDGPQGSIPQQPRLNYGTEYAVTLSFPPSTLQEGDQLQVALNRTRTFFSSASATGDAPVAAVVKHDVTAGEAAAQTVTVTLSTNTRAMIDQVNGIDHPVRGFFGVHVLRGQSFVTLAVADALMLSLESGPDAISPSLPVVDYPTREEAEQIKQDTIAAQEKAEQAQRKAEEAQRKAETAEDNAQIWAEGTDLQVEELGGEHSAKEWADAAGQSAENADQSATNAEQSATDANTAKGAAETACDAAVTAKRAAETAEANAAKIAEGSDADVASLGLEHSAKGWAQEAETALTSKRDILQTLVTSSSTALVVEAGKSYNWTVSAASTISMKAADKVAGKETRIDIYIDLQDGGSVSGDGVAVADAVLQSGWYKLIWDGTDATLYSTKAGGAASVITIPAATTTYTLQDNKNYQQVPDAVPTYTLPAATMDGLVHEITVLVDFLHITSCSFVDASGVPVTLQSVISPQVGEAYIFRCYWYGKWRVVPLKIRNAATVSSATGVVEVTDAVVGDALALKMTAPRSVVVNQLFNPAVVTGGVDYTGASNSGLTNNDSVFTIFIGAYGRGVYFNNTEYLFTAGTKVLLHCTCKLASQENLTIKTVYKGFLKKGDNTVSLKDNSPVTDFDTAQTFTNIFTIPETATYLLNIQAGGQSSAYLNLDFTAWDIEVINLTQYFNGDSALIDSITSWDDLVAYDPRFASYVAYNTGTVTGVQPTVKATGKNLFNPDLNSVSNYFTLQEDGSYHILNPGSAYGKVFFAFGGSGYNGQVALSYKVKYDEAAIGGLLTITYSDGTFDSGRSQVKQVTTWQDVVIVSNANKIVTRISWTYYAIPGTSVKDVQLEPGSAPTSYEPYHDGGTAQAPAPLFAVGNAADEFEAVAGVTTQGVDKVDLSTLRWAREQANGWVNYLFYATLPSTWKRSNNADILSADFSFNNDITTVVGTSDGYTTRSNGNIYIKADKYTTVADFKTAMTGHYIYFELATPTTSQSTPTQISLQAGNNVAMQTDGGRTLAGLSLTYENLPSAN